jgi:hypothetical protein
MLVPVLAQNQTGIYTRTNGSSIESFFEIRVSDSSILISSSLYYVYLLVKGRIKSAWRQFISLSRPSSANSINFKMNYCYLTLIVEHNII